MANATENDNCFLDQSSDDLSIELSDIDSSILMSLLEDSQVEYGDEEMLRFMIQSLEPEIMNQDSRFETCSSGGSLDDQLESCCSTSPDHHLDFEWIDTEMAYSCPSDEFTNYFIGHFTENIATVAELGGLRDYSQVCYGMPMEEDDYIGLWQ